MIPCHLFNSAPILLDLDAASESDVLHALIQSQHNRPEITNLPDFESAVLQRQKIQPPILNHGIALPHARTRSVSQLFLTIARCKSPIPFGPNQIPIQLIFLYGVPIDCITTYLESVASLTKTLRAPTVVADLISANSPEHFRSILTKAHGS